MTTVPTYIDDGWGALNGAIIFCPSQVPLPITPEVLISACENRWPSRTVALTPTDVDSCASVDIRPENEYSFVISLYEQNMLIGLDGLPQQNVVVAAWLRSLMPEDAPRMVVGDKGFSVQAELPYGVTAEQIASSMISHAVEGWNAADPDLQW